MTVTHVATSVFPTTYGTTTYDVPYPAGISADNGLWMLVAASSSAVVTFPTISGWTLIYDLALGGGTIGAGTGPRRMGLYRKDTVTGSESGTVTVTPTGGSNVVGGCITCWSVAAGKVFGVAYAQGQDTAPGTATSITADSILGETAGDVMVGFIAAPANSNMSSQTFTATGATYGTATELTETGTTTGDDMRCAAIQRPITAGTASAATVYAAGSTQSAGCLFIRLREVDPPGVSAAATLTATATLTAATTADRPAAASLTGTATLTAGAEAAHPAAAMLTATATLTAAADRTAVAAATLAATATLTADATVGTPPILAAAALTASATLTATATRAADAGATLTVTATATATASRSALLAATLALSATLTAGTSLASTVGAVLALTAALTAVATVTAAYTPAYVGLDGGTGSSGGHDGTLTTVGGLAGGTTATGLW